MKGRRVLLTSEYYFDEGSRPSRITAITRNIARPNEAYIECSYAVNPSKIALIESEMIQFQAAIGERLDREHMQVLRSWDSSDPSEYNVFSAIRTLREIARAGLKYLRKDVEDTAAGLIHFLKGIDVQGLATFLDGLSSHDFAPGPTGMGFHIDGRGHGELESLTLRRFLEVPELRYNRVEITVGDRWRAPGGGLIESVDVENRVVTLKLEEGEIGTIHPGDICMGVFHSFDDADNAPATTDDSRGNRTFAGFYTAYFRVTEVLGDDRRRFRYEPRPTSDAYARQFHPAAAMNFVAYGSFTDPARRTSVYETRTYQRYLAEVDDWEFAARNIVSQFGDLDNLIVHGIAMHGYGLYSNNAYLTGSFCLRTGEDILTRFEVLEGKLRSAMQKVEKNLTEEANHLTNATFFNDLEGWEGENEVVTFGAGGELVGLGMDFLVDKRKLAEVSTIDGRPALRLLDSHVRQPGAMIRRPASPETRLYLNLQYTCRRAGTLTVGFEGTSSDYAGGLQAVTFDITPGIALIPYAAVGTWDGSGAFVIRCTGEVYVEALTLTDRPLDEYKKEVSSLFEQTESKIQAWVKEVDHINNTIATSGWITEARGLELFSTLRQYNDLGILLAKLDASLTVAADRIEGIVSRVDNVDGLLIEQSTAITQTAADIRLAVNRGPGFPIYKDFYFSEGQNGIAAYPGGEPALTLKRLAIYRGAYAPTASNAPAVDWTTAALRAQHVGEVFRNTAIGRSYTYSEAYTWVAGTPEFGAVADDQPAVLRVEKIEGYATPGLGGFGWGALLRSDAVYEARFTARIPIGFKIKFDAQGLAGDTVTRWLTGTEGTGDWKEYRFQISTAAGSSSALSFYLSSAGDRYATEVTWYLSKATVFDLSEYEDPIAYINLSPEGSKIKAPKIELEGYTTINDGFEVLPDGSTITRRGKFLGSIGTPLKRIEESDAQWVSGKYRLQRELNIICPDGGTIVLPNDLAYDGDHVYVLDPLFPPYTRTVFPQTTIEAPAGEYIYGVQMTDEEILAGRTAPRSVTILGGFIELWATPFFDYDRQKTGIRWVIKSIHTTRVTYNY